jgi:hypothetical protein
MVAFTSNLVSTSWGVTMDRRKFLKAGTTLAVAASSSAMANDPVRYPADTGASHYGAARSRVIAG